MADIRGYVKKSTLRLDIIPDPLRSEQEDTR